MKHAKQVLTILISICLLIISASVICYSVTFGKYIRNKNSNNVSSVAMFGVAMTWSNNAFLDTYEKGSPSRVVVQSTSKTMAPGLSNQIILSLRGKCEVAFNLKITIIEEYSEHWKESSLTTAKPYHPMRISASSTYLNREIEIVDNIIDINYAAPGLDLVEDIIITWEWQADLNDEADTYMGTLTNVATYSLSADSIATQID